jgi:hypothetical protein
VTNDHTRLGLWEVVYGRGSRRQDQLVGSDDRHRDLHDSVNIRVQDTSTEDRHRVADIANGIPGHWLKKGKPTKRT